LEHFQLRKSGSNVVVKDLQKNQRRSLVVAGEQQPAEVHALVQRINGALGILVMRFTTPSR